MNNIKIFGIDISVWQSGIKFSSLKKEGVNFIIMRGAHTAKDKSMNKDTEFENYYLSAKNNNIPVGCYYFSRAINYEEGKKEALFLYDRCLKNKVFEYPIYIDVEDNVYQQKAGKEAVTNAIKGFCETLEAKGYYVGVYCNLNFLKNYMDYEQLRKKYDYWIALWNKNEPDKARYSYGMWQFGGETNLVRSNKIAGYTCDQNYAFKNYPKIMKDVGLNGYKKQIIIEEAEEKQEETPLPDLDINDEVEEDLLENEEEVLKPKKGNLLTVILRFIIRLFIKR